MDIFNSQKKKVLENNNRVGDLLGDFAPADIDLNVVIKYYKKDASGNKIRDYSVRDDYSSTSDISFLVGAMWSNRDITSIFVDGMIPLMEYDGTTKELKVNNNYKNQVDRIIDALHSREALVVPKDWQVAEVLARQVVQLANILNGSLTNISKETYFNQVEAIAEKLIRTATRNEVLEYLKNVIDNKETSKLNKRWAMQIHNGITSLYRKTEAYKEASDNNLVDATRTPLDYITMTAELVKTAEANGTPIDVINACKKKGIDLSIGIVSTRAVFDAICDAFQEMMIQSEKKKMEIDILHLNK